LLTRRTSASAQARRRVRGRTTVSTWAASSFATSSGSSEPTTVSTTRSKTS
jgi:hypothetical protein